MIIIIIIIIIINNNKVTGYLLIPVYLGITVKRLRYTWGNRYWVLLF